MATIAAPSRREARRHNRRAAIIAVAQRSFLEHGYAGTTMSAIACALGGSKGTLWSYFPSKEVLFAAVLEDATEAFRRQVSLILNPQDDLADALERFCREFLTMLASPDAIALYRLVVGEANRFPEVGEIFFARGPRRVQELLGRYLGAAMERGALRREMPIRAARHLIGLCVYSLHQQLLMGAVHEAEPVRIETEARLATATFLRAYAP
ncbi:MAG: TetR/AcrR family transcriptional regulator [Novosphingobium sp.]|nr:TetR/AcrR family transcriptional regulator [Novosphingobium sp.]